ncbi:hypothetical protein AURDEDRAFT_171254 [Auricularia subglabra TFB-10046 SS5]|nr:hypothetical protein AURDEDRAFT_171254 [Auricularia subglabra TFB-10046 SS5]
MTDSKVATPVLRPVLTQCCAGQRHGAERALAGAAPRGTPRSAMHLPALQRVQFGSTMGVAAPPEDSQSGPPTNPPSTPGSHVGDEAAEEEEEQEEDTGPSDMMSLD